MKKFVVKVRRGEIDRKEASEVLEAFERAALEIYPSAVLLPAALELALGFDRSVYDCLYLALAIAQSCELITADRKFHSVVTASPFASQIRWVEDELSLGEWAYSSSCNFRPLR